MVKLCKAKNRIGLPGNAGSVHTVGDGCTGCGICVRECSFLGKYGTPGKIGLELSAGRLDPEVAFECSLCGLCTAVCPEPIDPASMFSHLRAEAVTGGSGQFRAHWPLLFFESMGTSPLLSWIGLPENCTTVFFPGCSLAGSRPQRVTQVYESLKTLYPALGVVLDCCSAPSQILGRKERFTKSITSLIDNLQGVGIEKVLVACPTCYFIFSQYGKGVQVSTVYQELALLKENFSQLNPFTVTVHDPCSVRCQPAVHEAVRTLIGQLGGEVDEMKHHGVKTICCGQGGAVNTISPQYGSGWALERCQEAGDRVILTYCSCCSEFLGRQARAGHVLDLLYGPENRLLQKKPAGSGLASYIRRWRLRHRFSGKIRAALTGKRSLAGAVRWLRLRG